MPTDSPDTLAVGFRLWILLVAAILAAAAFLAYYRTTPAVQGRLRWLLFGLRLAAFVLIAGVLMDPRYVLRSDRKEPARVIALVDRSASMALPASGWQGGASRFEAAVFAAGNLGQAVESGKAEFQTAYFSKNVTFGGGDSVRADGQGTDIVGALEEVARRVEGEHVTGVVLFTDGADTEEQLVRRSIPDIPVFAVGFGDTNAPEDVRIKEVDYNSVVRVPSRSSIQATLAYTGKSTTRVKIVLKEGNRNVFEKDTLISPAASELVQDIPVRFLEPGRREFALSVDVTGHDAEPDNNRRDIVIEAEKAKAKIVIVDMQPGWELHFLTDFLRRDQTVDFDVVGPASREASAGTRVIDGDEFVAALTECDAAVLGSLSDDFLSANVAAALERFVRERGGGLLVLPGEGSLFEHASAWTRVSDILPVRGTPPFRFELQYTSVLPGAQAAGNPITSQLLPLFSQTEWQERSPLLGYYGAIAPNPASDVLLGVRGRSLPAVAYQTVGKGRVAVVSAGPLWRWKFLSEENTVYDEFVSRLLDVLSRGEETDRFVISAKKNVFDAGESPVVFAEIFNEKMQPVTGVPVRLEVARREADGSETPLKQVSMTRENAQSTRFESELATLPPGRYVVHGQAELTDRTIASRPLDIQISATSVEYQRVQQDVAALVGIARRSGGAYANARDLDGLVAHISLDPRTVQSVTEMTLRTSVLLFLVILALLSAEWLIRKRAGMI